MFKTLQVDTTNSWYGTNIICVFCSRCLHALAIYIYNSRLLSIVTVSSNIVLKVCGYAWNAKLYTCTCRFSGQINSFLQWYNLFFEYAWREASGPQCSPEHQCLYSLWNFCWRINQVMYRVILHCPLIKDEFLSSPWCSIPFY